MPVSTFNPNADPESTSVDGAVEHDIAGTAGDTWAAVRGGAGNGAFPSSATKECGFVAAGTDVNKWNYMERGIFLFDISSIPVGATVTAATFQLYVDAKVDNLGGSHQIALVTSTPAGNTNLLSGDFAQLGTTQQATNLTVAGITTSAYNTWTLNATGIATVQAAIGGVVKLGIRLEADRANSEPSWTSAAEAGLSQVQYAEAANKPVLTVTYTAGGVQTTSFFM